jgi:transposase
VCDDYSGYKALFASGVTEAGCLTHAGRKFHELWVNQKSFVGEQALALFGRLYEVEREVAGLDGERRRCIRQEKARPIADALRAWLTAQRQTVPPGSATAKAIDYTLGRWPALTRYIDDGDLRADNNWVENQIRPIAIGRSNWLFAGSLRAGKRAAAAMSLIHSARMNGHDPYAYLREILERLPTQRASQVGALLPHRWMAPLIACESRRPSRRDHRTLTAGQPPTRRATDPDTEVCSWQKAAVEAIRSDRFTLE